MVREYELNSTLGGRPANFDIALIIIVEAVVFYNQSKVTPTITVCTVGRGEDCICWVAIANVESRGLI